MSFLDQLSKNFNSQNDFFSKISNFAQSSNDASTDKSMDLSKSTSKNSKQSDDDFKVEKEDFFITAKKVFEKEDRKLEENSQKSYDTNQSKELDAKNLKNKNKKDEEVEQILDYIFGMINPQNNETVSEISLNETQIENAKKALEILQSQTDNTEARNSTLSFFLDKINTKFGIEIDSLTKEIIDIDLQTEEGVASILEVSNEIETLSQLQEAIDLIQAQLKQAEVQQAQNENSNDDQSNKDLGLKQVQHEEINLNKDPKTQDSTLTKILDDLKSQLRSEDSKKQDLTDPNKQSKANTATDTFDVKIFKGTEARAETLKNFNFNKADIQILEAKNTDASESQQGSDFANDNFETLFPKEIKVTNLKVRSLSKPIAIKQIPEFISKEIPSMKTNSKQEIKMVLNPENLGKMQLNISKEGNQIHISMIVRTDEAATKLEQKINDIQVILKEKGFESNIEVNKSSTENSNQSQTNQEQSKHDNEAKNEQMNKFLDQAPTWLNQELESARFEDALNQVI